eukprot:11209314-Lingulodinium_polyedra.AAC.1
MHHFNPQHMQRHTTTHDALADLGCQPLPNIWFKLGTRRSSPPATRARMISKFVCSARRAHEPTRQGHPPLPNGRTT